MVKVSLPKPKARKTQYDLLEIGEKLKGLVARGTLKAPRKPEPSMPRIEQNYRNLGEALGHCPYELKEIINAALNSDNELVVAAWQDLITNTKLALEIPLGPVRATVENSKRANAERLLTWEEECKKIEKENKVNAKASEEYSREILKIWGDLLIEFGNKLARNNNIAKLSESDQYLVRAMYRKDYLKIKEMLTGERLASIDLKACKKASAMDIVRLYEEVEKLRAEDEANRLNSIRDHMRNQMLWGRAIKESKWDHYESEWADDRLSEMESLMEKIHRATARRR